MPSPADEVHTAGLLAMADALVNFEDTQFFCLPLASSSRRPIPMNIFSPDSIYYEHFDLLWLTTSYHLAQGLDNIVDLEGVLYEVRCPELAGMTEGDVQLMTTRVITLGAVNAGGVEGCRKALIDALQQIAYGRLKHVDVRADDEKYKELSGASPLTGAVRDHGGQVVSK